MRELSKAFEEANSGVRILSEAAGSLHSARKITELGRSCDIMLSADHYVVSSMLISFSRYCLCASFAPIG